MGKDRGIYDLKTNDNSDVNWISLATKPLVSVVLWLF